MWEKLNKVATQNLIAVIIIVGCFVLATIAAVGNISPESQSFISTIVGPAMVGVIGWLYTQSKNGNSIKP